MYPKVLPPEKADPTWHESAPQTRLLNCCDSGVPNSHRVQGSRWVPPESEHDAPHGESAASPNAAASRTAEIARKSSCSAPTVRGCPPRRPSFGDDVAPPSPLKVSWPISCPVSIGTEMPVRAITDLSERVPSL